MDELGSVLLEVRPGDRDPERPLRGLDPQAPVRGQRDRVLADLVALGEVRVEVVLALPLGPFGDRRLDRDAGGDHKLHGAAVDHRQHAGERKADRADMGVRGRVGIGRGAGAEHLRARAQLTVDLDPDDRLVPLQHGTGSLDRGGHAFIATPAVARYIPYSAIVSHATATSTCRAARRTRDRSWTGRWASISVRVGSPSRTSGSIADRAATYPRHVP